MVPDGDSLLPVNSLAERWFEMLIEFSVTNFRSIKEEACLSLVANRDKKHGDSNVVEPKLAENGRPIWLLRSAAIYGANAAGKTNLLRGLSTMRNIVLRSSNHLDELPVTPSYSTRMPYATDIFRGDMCRGWRTLPIRLLSYSP